MSFLRRLSCCAGSSKQYKLPDMLPEDAGITTPLLPPSPNTPVNDKVKQVFSQFGQYIEENGGVELRFRAENGQTTLSNAFFKRVAAGSSKTISLKLMAPAPSAISSGLTGTMSFEINSSNLEVTFLLQKNQTNSKGGSQHYPGNSCTTALSQFPEHNPEGNYWTLALDQTFTVYSAKSKKLKLAPIQARWIDFLPPPPPAEGDEDEFTVVQLDSDNK